MRVWTLFAALLPLSVPFSVREAAFTFPRPGHRLRGQPLHSRTVRSTSGCANACVRMDECLAYNYDESGRSCHLMGTNDVLDEEPDPAYQIVRKKLTCAQEPCLNGGTCINEPTSINNIRNYRCACPCGRCGSRCETLHFGQVENACIYLFNAGYKHVESPEECMSFCWDTPGCKSVDFIGHQGACWLNSVTSDEEEPTLDCDKWYPGVGYMFFNCTCDA